MSILENARQGTLTGDFIDKRIDKILNGQDPETGLTPLATAVVEGFPNVVKALLEKGAKADGLSQNEATPLLLAVWKGKKKENCAQIVQLLLQKLPPGPESIDKTCSAADGKTPLIFAVDRKEAESVRLLRKAGAALQTANGLDAQMIAKRNAEKTGDWSIHLALDPKEDKEAHDKMTETVINYLVYILAWANNSLDGIVRKTYGLDPVLNGDYDGNVNYDGLTDDKDRFLINFDDFLKNTKLAQPLRQFFGKHVSFVEELASSVVNLQVTGTKAINQALYQHVIYCDDSSSMKRQSRWENQKQLVERLTKIITRVLPVGEGVTLRFINRELAAADSSLTAESVNQILGPMTWQPGGDTPIGTNLRSKILEPLVYAKIADKTFSRPLLVVVITDGMPEPESNSALTGAILECGRKLKEAQYPETKKLDAEFIDLKVDEKGLDRWLIENLFSPFQGKL
ncbi:transcription factor [Grosmannia clavigera kw1407]|uniref:Transcription factor n=1 Tax=Grosmannia clavigera (strain kw1407 / UAMH 11150) TaxID=655863 RepID=F0XQM5_GROCL|nr:transcription factor [Grosmannia clavigera kw1407]EFW99766.1 transcription factor [Grosmannia clavigera kw1407]